MLFIQAPKGLAVTIAALLFSTTDATAQAGVRTCDEITETIETYQALLESHRLAFQENQSASACMAEVIDTLLVAEENVAQTSDDGFGVAQPALTYPECAEAYGALTLDLAIALFEDAAVLQEEAREGARAMQILLDEEVIHSAGCP